MRQELVERELTSEGPRRGGGVAARRRSVTVNLAESPLGWLHAHGHLDDRLFDAGERLRADYERAQLAPAVTMRWEPVRIGIWPIVALREAEDLFSALHHCDVHCCKNPIRTFLINQFAPLFEIRVNCGTMLVL